MEISTKAIVAKVGSLMKRDYSAYSIKLPPISMRLMGKKFYNDAYYLKTVLDEGERFANRLNVNEKTEILEVGCSSGRSVLGLVQRIPRVKRYIGVDARRINVEWCRKHIGSEYNFCTFRYIDLHHDLYNPKGTLKFDDHFKFDFASESFDIVYMQSVLGNNDDREVSIFAQEFYRLLRPAGKLFLTAFIEENVPDCMANPDGYIMKCEYPKQIVRFEKKFFLNLFRKEGFVVDCYEQGTEIDFQSAVYFSKP
jgi:SAM-dependent methyltransferase